MCWSLLFFFFDPWLDANGHRSQVAYFWRDRRLSSSFHLVEYLMKSVIDYDWTETFLVVVGIGQSLNVIC